MFLRQSTASQSVIIGPFIDDTDFKTPETALTISNTDVKLSKNGAAQVNKNSGGATHRGSGYYSITLDATDTNTVGELFVTVNESGALPVPARYVVLEEAIYDGLFASGATAVPSDLTEVGGVALASATAGYVPSESSLEGGFAGYIDLTVTDATYTPTSTQFEVTALTSVALDLSLVGRLIYFPDSGDQLYGASSFITEVSVSDKLLTVRALPAAPVSGDKVRIARP